jgi:hypothetical protein
MSESAPTMEEAQQRLADIEKQLAEVVPALQAEAMFLRGYLTALNTVQPEPSEELEA